MQSIKDSVVCITGASSGIGEACAELFAQNGARLVICARSPEKLAEVCERLKSHYGTEVFAFTLDVQDKAAVISTLIALPPQFSKIDILINNAGLGRGLDTVAEAKLEDWDDMVDTNIKGLLYVTRQLLPGMLERNKGHVINIGSTAGHATYAGGSVYCATKHAVLAISRTLKKELNGTRVRVSSVDPGAVETNFSVTRFKGDTERAAAVYKGIQPLTAADVADAVLYCASRPEHLNVNEIIMTATDQPSII